MLVRVLLWGLTSNLEVVLRPAGSIRLQALSWVDGWTICLQWMLWGMCGWSLILSLLWSERMQWAVRRWHRRRKQRWGRHRQ
ncbi:hypothetical protein [Reticulibacter mediterranei]|uniref:hypothetical protein n=1 Tax=Reticulibacter mediterranei TaxID=2778369 RepID=UPI001C69329E|nr:hypothetical protein [Reticulibacter mediterranei]